MAPAPLREPRTPWWFIVIILLVALPTVTFIPQAAEVVEQARWLGTAYMGWLYPAYVVISGICAWMCYPRRRALAWILVALVLLTDIGLFLTVAL